VHRIFLSSRDESIHSACRLGHLLGEHVGADEVFLPDSVPPGTDAATATADALRRCTACIVVIDRSWTDGRGLDAEDPVVRQVGTALQRGVRVLPVLVEGARPPRADDLPEPVRPLARLHAERMGHLTFRDDAVRVAEWVEATVKGEPSRALRRQREQLATAVDQMVPVVRRAWRITLWWLVFVQAIFVGFVVSELPGDRQQGTLGITIAVIVIALLLLGGCALALRREIRAQRRLLTRAGVRRPGGSLSAGRVGFLTVVCLGLAVLTALRG
jgi:hypothetical protein